MTDFDDWDNDVAPSLENTGTTPPRETPAETPQEGFEDGEDGYEEVDQAGFQETPIAQDDPFSPAALAQGTVQDSAPSTFQGLSIDVDVVFVIDATGSMTPFLDCVKRDARSFMPNLRVKLDEAKRKVRNVRVKVIAFRDYYADEEPMTQSRFFNMNDPADANEYARFVDGIVPIGGGDEPESALEALHYAINSAWSSAPGAQRRRQIIVVATDATAHRLDDPKRATERDYPSGIPDSLAALNAEWLNPQIIGADSKRMVLYAPNAYPWTEISDWTLVIASSDVVELNRGVDEVNMAVIYAFIVNSL